MANAETHTGLGQIVRQLWTHLRDSLTGRRSRQVSPAVERAQAPVALEPLGRLKLTDGVSRTLFEEYAEHREGEVGHEETGWVLLGLRQKDEAVALATLPAGTRRDAGVAHVLFNDLGQAVGSRIVRQQDRRLRVLGVVHTHPGSLRHPSEGDWEGDSAWVRALYGGEGIFGIGTADVRPDADGEPFGHRPRANVQTLGALCFSWYSLRSGARQYRPLPVELTLGPDLARPLHDVWPALEEHAAALDRLARQQAGLNCGVVEEEDGPALAVNVPLAEKGDGVRVLLGDGEPRYFVQRGGEVFSVDPGANSLDHGVYLLLAEIASRSR